MSKKTNDQEGDWDADAAEKAPAEARIIKVVAPAPAAVIPQITPATLPPEAAPQIPNTLAELLPLLTRLDNKPRTFAGHDARHTALLAEVRRRVFALQQGLPVLGDVQHAQHVINSERTQRGPELRKVRLAKLAAFLARPLAPTNAKPVAGAPKLLSRLLADDSVKSQLANCRKLMAEAEMYAVRYFSMAYPQSRLEEVQMEMNSGPEPEALSALQSECSALKVALTHRSDLNVQGRIQQGYAPALESIRSLVALCGDLLTAWQAEAEDSEREFFEAHDLATERTVVSRQFAHFKATLPAPSQTALQWFGVDDITNS